MFLVEDVAFTRVREQDRREASCLHGTVSCSVWMEHRIRKGLRKNEGGETQGQIIEAS